MCGIYVIYIYIYKHSRRSFFHALQQVCPRTEHHRCMKTQILLFGAPTQVSAPQCPPGLHPPYRSPLGPNT